MNTISLTTTITGSLRGGGGGGACVEGGGEKQEEEEPERRTEDCTWAEPVMYASNILCVPSGEEGCPPKLQVLSPLQPDMMVVLGGVPLEGPGGVPLEGLAEQLMAEAGGGAVAAPMQPASHPLFVDAAAMVSKNSKSKSII